MWTRKKKFSQIFHNSFRKLSKLNTWKSQLLKRRLGIFEKTAASEKNFNGRVIWTFDNPAEILKLKSENFTSKVDPHWSRKIIFFSRKCNFGRMFPPDKDNSAQALMPKNQGESHVFLCSKAKKTDKILYFLAKRFFFKCFLDTNEVILTTLLQSFR